jgi:hypothetical protein
MNKTANSDPNLFSFSLLTYLRFVSISFNYDIFLDFNFNDRREIAQRCTHWKDAVHGSILVIPVSTLHVFNGQVGLVLLP